MHTKRHVRYSAIFVPAGAALFVTGVWTIAAHLQLQEVAVAAEAVPTEAAAVQEEQAGLRRVRLFGVIGYAVVSIVLWLPAHNYFQEHCRPRRELRRSLAANGLLAVGGALASASSFVCTRSSACRTRAGGGDWSLLYYPPEVIADRSPSSGRDRPDLGDRPLSVFCRPVYYRHVVDG